MRWLVGVPVLGILGVVGGCASITTDSLQLVSLTSDPVGAVCRSKAPRDLPVA